MLYHYVGPPELRANFNTERARIKSGADVLAWARRNGEADEFVVTFIVNARSELWIADRRSEHIACAAGESVRSAGEITFSVDNGRAIIVGATNQSTGFCPPPSTWLVLSAALDAAGLSHPDDWSACFEFRRCEECDAINLVKDDWFVCALCDAELAREWNCGA